MHACQDWVGIAKQVEVCFPPCATRPTKIALEDSEGKHRMEEVARVDSDAKLTESQFYNSLAWAVRDTALQRTWALLSATKSQHLAVQHTTALPCLQLFERLVNVPKGKRSSRRRHF